MLKQRSGLALSAALLLTTSVGSATAQQSGSTVPSAIECGGQYECIEDRPLTAAEARASLGYPHAAQPQEPARQETAKASAPESTITK
jgi:hypothetical protein